jgi:choline dehydrogenase-like flavoprotein
METNRVTLDPNATDSDGVPAPPRAVGATETNDTGVIYPPPGWHLMGTCRMGNTRRRQLTDHGRRGESHLHHRRASRPVRRVHHPPEL